MDYAELARQMVDLHAEHYSEMSQIARQMAAGGETIILHLLYVLEGEVFAEDLARQTGLSAGRVASILKKLEERGVIRRTRNETNRRKYLIELTEEGRAVARESERGLIYSHEQLLRELGEDDARNLLRIVTRLCDVCQGAERPNE